MPMAPPMAPAAPAGPDFSSLERHLFKITSQIEALQRPDGIEQSIAAFRGELAEIRHAITEAMPRRAIESIENEIRSLSRRIDDTRQSGTDGQALAGIERALGEIREVLRSLTPAEQLAGYDEAIRNLGAKLDLILRANDDPSTVQQLEGAIAALRAIVSNVASNDALARLSDDVHMLSSKVDQLSRSEGNSDSFAILEQRIAALTSTLESRERPAASESTEHLEGALRALSDRIDRMPVGNDNASAFAHLEQRVSYLLERLEASTDHRAAAISAGSRTGCRTSCAISKPSTRTSPRWPRTAAATPARRSRSTAAWSTSVKRELSDIRFSQSETDRHTQDSLEAVHNTLGHVVDRLAMIEGDLRTARAPARLRRSRRCRRRRKPAPPQAAAPRVAMPPQPKPELPNPAAAQGQSISPPRRGNSRPCSRRRRLSPPVTPRAISEILEPHTARRRAPRSRRICRPIIRSNRAPGRPDGWRRRRSASPLPKARSAKFRRPAARAGQHLQLHCRRAPRRAGRRGRASPADKSAARRPARRGAAGDKAKEGLRPSPPRSARCWSARAWSSSCSAPSRWR